MTDNTIEEVVIENKDVSEPNPVTNIEETIRLFRSVLVTFNIKEARDAWLADQEKKLKDQHGPEWILCFIPTDYSNKWTAQITMQLNKTEEQTP